MYKKWLILLMSLFLSTEMLCVQAIDVEDASVIEYVEMIDQEEVPSEDIYQGFEIPYISGYTVNMFSGIYGDQLDGIEREVYQLMEGFNVTSSVAGIELELEDAYEFEVTYGQLRDGTYKESEAYNDVRMNLRTSVFRASDAFLKDRVDIYWLRNISYQGTISFERTEEITEETVVEARISKIKIKPVYYYAEIFNEIDDVEKALNEAVKILDATKYENSYEHLRGIYEYVMDLAEYHYENMDAASNHTITGILLDKYNHKGTCEGYAKLIKWLCDYYAYMNVMVIGGSSYDVEGDLRVDHCWNIVRMEDGQWYVLDATWDDTGLDVRYFLVGSEESGQNHYMSPYFSYTEYEPFVLPTLAETAYKVPVIEVGTVTDVRAYAVGKQKVKLEWKEVPDVDGYLIYGHKKGEYGYVGMTTEEPMFIDYKALDDQYNFYWIYPFRYDANDKMIVGSCETYVSSKGICVAVKNLKASSLPGAVGLTWEKSRDAEGYFIYGIENGENYVYIGMTERTEFMARNASTQQYNFYWVFPYHISADGKIIVGATPKYTYGKAR